MARKTPARPTPPARRRPLLRAAVAALGCVAAVGGVAWAGLAAVALIDHRDRFNLPLSAIDFDPPSGVDRTAFLAEVRYLGDLPDRFNTYDPAATGRVHAAFAKHPWVERVGGGYTTVARRYVLTVVFRQPALKVTVLADGRPTTRAVDAAGVVLPAGAVADAIPELIGTVESPIPAAGAVWDDPTVLRAAALAARHDAATVAKAADGWRITDRGGRVLVVGR